MTDDELAKIKAHADEAQRLASGSLTVPQGKLEWLLAEYAIAASQEYVPALLTEVERLREIVQAVADFDTNSYPDGAYCCHWCGAMDDGIGDKPTPHTETCPVTKARALLAGK